MSSKTKVTLDFLSYVGSTTNNPSDAEKIKLSVEESAVTEVWRRKESVITATSDQNIPLPDAASDYLLIFVDQTITIKLNSSVSAITLTPKAAGTKTPVFYLKGTISALTISNASGNTANLDIIAMNV